MTLIVVGVDPGPTTGIVELICEGLTCAPGRIVQCNGSAAVCVLDAIVSPGCVAERELTTIAVERFVHSRYGGKAPGQATQYLINHIDSRYRPLAYVSVVVRSASAVKPWANDERLERVGLWRTTKGMLHARDAARHALFTAVRDHGVLDPLSTRRLTPK